MSAVPLSETGSGIDVGNHITGTWLGLTFNLDTIWSTLFAGAVVLGLGFWLRSKSSSGVPSKIQLFWESLVTEVTHQVQDNLGRVNPFVVPLAIALFIFILVSNWVEVIPSGEGPRYLPAPTADVNLVYALALLVIVGVHVFGVRSRGLKNYVKHFFQPYPIMFPLNILEEIMKPFTLALRLFGNIFAGGIMISLIASLFPLYLLWGPNIIWKLFDMFIGGIQAFIFALLTVLYFGMAGDTHEDEGYEDGTQSSSAENADSSQPEGAREPQPAAG
ncbi:MAG: F0F1 ATP synthase subunit A [Nocardioidaceae bacterium]